jgi:hypothetical protein
MDRALSFIGFPHALAVAGKPSGLTGWILTFVD